MKTVDIRCVKSPTKVHRMRPTDGTMMLCLDCEFELPVFEHAYVVAALANGGSL